MNTIENEANIIADKYFENIEHVINTPLDQQTKIYDGGLIESTFNTEDFFNEYVEENQAKYESYNKYKLFDLYDDFTDIKMKDFQKKYPFANWSQNDPEIVIKIEDMLRFDDNTKLRSFFPDERNIFNASKNYYKDYESCLYQDEFIRTMHFEKDAMVDFITNLEDRELLEDVRIFGYDKNDNHIFSAYSNNENTSFDETTDFKVEDLEDMTLRDNCLEKLRNADKLFIQMDIETFIYSKNSFESMKNALINETEEELVL